MANIKIKCIKEKKRYKTFTLIRYIFFCNKNDLNDTLVRVYYKVIWGILSIICVVHSYPAGDHHQGTLLVYTSCII